MAKNLNDETRSNTFKPKVVQALVERIERCGGELLSLRGTYMQECKTVREDISNIYEEGKAAGIPKKELKAVLKKRELDRKIEAIREDLTSDSQDTFDQLLMALGELADSPLGEAAMRGHSADDDSSAAIVNTAALESGIKTLTH